MPLAAKSSRTRRRTRQPAKPALSLVAPWSLRRSRGLRILQLAPFSRIPWLVHGFSTRPGGTSDLDGESVLNLGFMEWDNRDTVLKNRRRFQSAVGADSLQLVPLKQFHSSLARVFSAPLDTPLKGDASLTATPGLLLGVQTADCVPILLVDTRRRAVAAIHAGWRGTLARIAEKTVGRLRYEFGTKPSDLLAAIGPSIGPCCYDVSTDLVTRFSMQFADSDSYFDEARTGDEPNPLQWLNMRPPGHQPPPKNVQLDLVAANRSQLLAAGLSARNIFASALCTGCHPDLFFSHRKEGPRSGRLLSVIGIRPGPARKS